MKKMPLFSRPRSPAEIVRNLKEALNTLERGGDSKKQEKVINNKSNDFIALIAAKYRRKSASDIQEDNLENRKKRLFTQVWSKKFNLGSLFSVSF